MWGETSRDCAERRLREELGITGLQLRRVGGIEYRADVGRNLIEHEVVDLFVAKASRRPGLTLDPDEVMETAWISLSDLTQQVQATPERFTPWLRIYLAESWGEVTRTLPDGDADSHRSPTA